MNITFGSSHRMYFLAGVERGIRMSYMSRAYGTDSYLRFELVKQAREANREMIRYLKAARNSQ